MHEHTQNSIFVGDGLSLAGTRDGRKVFCQAPLLNSQEGIQTQAGERQPNCTATEKLSVNLGHIDGASVRSLFCVSGKNRRERHHSSDDPENGFTNMDLILSNLNFLIFFSLLFSFSGYAELPR